MHSGFGTRTSNLRILRSETITSSIMIVRRYYEESIMWKSSVFIYVTTLTLCFIHINTVTASAIPPTAQGQLIRDLLDTGYDIREVPYREQEGPIEIMINCYLFSILDLDTKNGILHGISFLSILWHDHRLVWSPENHGNISLVSVPLTSVWTPSLQLFNSAGSGQTQSPFQTDGNIVQVWANGTVYMQSNLYFSTICFALLVDFPFDSHNCTVGFFPLGISDDYIRLIPGLVLSLVNQNAEWRVNGMGSWASAKKDAFTRKWTCFLDIIISLERQPNFYLRNILCPLVLFIILAFSTFWIPIKSGERVSASLSLVLGNTVFQIIITDIMPRTSNPADEPLIVYFCVSSFALITALTVWSMLVSNLSFKKWSLNNSAARRFFFDVLPVLTLSKPLRCCRSRHAVEDTFMEDQGKQEITEVQLFDHTSTHTPVHRAQQHPAEQCGDDSQVSDMEIIAKMLDRLAMGLVFVLILVIAIRTDPLVTATFKALLA